MLTSRRAILIAPAAVIDEERLAHNSLALMMRPISVACRRVASRARGLVTSVVSCIDMSLKHALKRPAHEHCVRSPSSPAPCMHAEWHPVHVAPSILDPHSHSENQNCDPSGIRHLYGTGTVLTVGIRKEGTVFIFRLWLE